MLNPLSTNPTKLSNTLKQFVGKLPMNCLSVFDHFVKLAFTELTIASQLKEIINVRSYHTNYYFLSETEITQYLKYYQSNS